jgi:hypothetical protein
MRLGHLWQERINVAILAHELFMELPLIPIFDQLAAYCAFFHLRKSGVS